MKLEKENAVDRADQAEQRQKDFEEKLKAVSATTDLVFRIVCIKHCWFVRSFIFLVGRRKQCFAKTYPTDRSWTRCCSGTIGWSQCQARSQREGRCWCKAHLLFFFFSFLSLHSSDDIHHQFSMRIFYPFQLSRSPSLFLFLFLFIRTVVAVAESTIPFLLLRK